jgi:iron complex transport system substrate-binding protein
VASAAATPSRLTDDKGFFSQWAAVADQRDVQVLYRNLQFDIEAVVASAPTCWWCLPPVPTAPRRTWPS